MVLVPNGSQLYSCVIHDLVGCRDSTRHEFKLGTRSGFYSCKNIYNSCLQSYKPYTFSILANRRQNAT